MEPANRLVSVVTPVYNGELYLAECIESVLNQSFRDWEYVIVNNCSTDRTLEIAERFAAKDPRIRIHNNAQFFELTENWNHAVRQISPHSKYCKVVHADDLLFPDCLEQMVALSKKNSTIGVVGSYILKGKKITCDGLPYPRSVYSGREICRAYLLGENYVFGSPSSTLIRADLMRDRQHFYNEENYHADVEVMLDVLRDTDFGFVHQVLSFTRMHKESQTSTYAKRFLTDNLNRVWMLKKYGTIYLEAEEFEREYRNKTRMYYRILASRLLSGAPKGLWSYHKQGLEKFGETLSVGTLGATYVSMVMRKLLGALIPRRYLNSHVR
jgi:glycosyltransferase involved in cell wall biosynthesis